jgi:predicted NBD/HSP70 family sugar kinase
LMRAINRYHVIDVIRRDGPIARVEIVERTALSPATISAITGALIEEGLIDVVRVEPSEGGARGRPRVLLRLNGSAYRVVGVKLSAHRIGIAVTDAKCEPLGTLALPVRISRQSPEVIADLVEDGVRQCVADAGLTLDMISGVGIGLPGVIDGDAGVSHWSPILGPSPVPFAREIERRLGTPTLIENDANLVTLAEHWFGQGRGLSTFAVVTIENTIGMGMLIEGRLHRGAHGIGPEFGHVKYDPAGPPCRCGQRGCLDAYASDAGILQAAIAAGCASAGGEASAHQLIAHVTERALAGDNALTAIFQRAGEVLGVGIANVINILSPPRIIVSGEGLRAGDLIREPMLAAIAANVLPKLREATEIIFHPWGDEMWARGAASIVLRRIYEAPWNNAA